MMTSRCRHLNPETLCMKSLTEKSTMKMTISCSPDNINICNTTYCRKYKLMMIWQFWLFCYLKKKKKKVYVCNVGLDRMSGCDGRHYINVATSREWDGEEHQRAERVWCSAAERRAWRRNQEARVMVWRRGECDGRMGFESFNFISSASVWGL